MNDVIKFVTYDYVYPLSSHVTNNNNCWIFFQVCDNLIGPTNVNFTEILLKDYPRSKIWDSQSIKAH